MKEHDFPFKSFIGGWYIPEYICDKLIFYFNQNKSQSFKGTIGLADRERVDTSLKDSTDLRISINETNPVIVSYRKHLNAVIANYQNKYDILKTVCNYGVNENYNIQHYSPGGGFKIFHSERTGLTAGGRFLVFMTYLNDVEDGGTEFKYQNIISPAKKGLTLIWPAEWTHCHRGVVSQYDKYIITGWIHYLI